MRVAANAVVTVASRSSQFSSSLFSRDAQDQQQIRELKQDAFEKLLAALRAMIH